MCRVLPFVLAGMFVMRGMASNSLAAFEIIAQSVEVDRDARETRFSLTFNQAPDFDTVDEFNRPANAFQYWYDSEPGGSEFAGEDVVVIRGPEIRFGDIPVRESLNESGEEFPNAEGWGESRGHLPFDLDGEELEFTVPWAVLGEDDEVFSYRLIALEEGSQTTDISGVFIELPTSLKTGVVALLIMLLGLRMTGRWAR